MELEHVIVISPIPGIRDPDVQFLDCSTRCRWHWESIGDLRDDSADICSWAPGSPICPIVSIRLCIIFTVDTFHRHFNRSLTTCFRWQRRCSSSIGTYRWHMLWYVHMSNLQCYEYFAWLFTMDSKHWSCWHRVSLECYTIRVTMTMIWCSWPTGSASASSDCSGRSYRWATSVWGCLVGGTSFLRLGYVNKAQNLLFEIVTTDRTDWFHQFSWRGARKRLMRGTRWLNIFWVTIDLTKRRRSQSSHRTNHRNDEWFRLHFFLWIIRCLCLRMCVASPIFRFSCICEAVFLR